VSAATTPSPAKERQAEPIVELRPAAELRLHEQQARVPSLPAGEYAAFRASVAREGVLVPLSILADSVVLDGRQRLQAARESGLGDVPVQVVAPEDEVEFMLRAAIERRHLSASQRAALAVELEQYRQLRDAGKRRQLANLRHSTNEVAELPPRGAKTRELAADWAGCSPRTIQDASTVHSHDPQLFEKVKSGELSAEVAARRVRRANRDARIPPAPPLPEGPFDLIYADPPWQLGNPDAASAPEQHYPTMPLGDIKALTVPAANDGVLYLWAVNSLLPEALAVMSAWGFQYRSNEVWVKQSIGIGVWTRNRHELLLIGRRGNASPPEPTLRRDSVIEAPRRKHSQKPVCVYERLEHLYPDRSKLELFGRGQPRRGWSMWGNEVAP